MVEILSEQDEQLETAEEQSLENSYKEIDVYVLTPEELQSVVDAVGELPTKFGSALFRGLQAIGERGTVKITVQK